MRLVDTDEKNNSVFLLRGEDALGRKILPVAGFNGKQVGLFYFLWIGQHGSASYDNSVLDIEAQKNERKDENVHHYWSRPVYGYYDSGDPWVFRKHLELFVAAGVDYLVFDATNTYYYEEVCCNIFPVALEMIEEGWNIPRFVFDTNCRSSETVEGIFNAYYDPSTENGRRFAPLWYRHGDEGNRNSARKPWIIAKNNGKGEEAKYNFDVLPERIKNFFYLRESAWFDEDSVPYAFATDVDNPTLHQGMLSVSVAQHPSGAFSDSVFEAGARDSNRGRGWSEKDKRNDEARVVCGSRFEEEWQRAFDMKGVNNVFLSTWNEWVAQKQPYGHCGRSCCYFVDQYNMEFSRDIEPSADALGDNYYMQMVSNIRRFKAVGGEIEPARPVRFTSLADDEGWRKAAFYRTFTGDGIARDYKSANFSLPAYRQTGAENDFTGVRVACDGQRLYFCIECENIREEKAHGLHFNVWLKTAGGGYSHRIYTDENGRAAVMTADGKTDANGAEAAYFAHSVRYSVPLAACGLSGKGFTLGFKATDGIDLFSDDVMETYSLGKCAPVGRFDWHFSFDGGSR